ncbi:MAG: TetR/AcrR family transcriptional regulator [Treponema sp.]|nr:TetR/AcrR family transcriptional regulator [Treponema sp.]
MAIVVEHDKRRKKILDKALTVFMDDGFENATFQKIADKCGITRTILYLYFKNKREIFIYSIKHLLMNVEENINTIRADDSLNSIEKISKVIHNIFTLLEQNRQLLCVVIDYLFHLSISKNDVSPELRVRRRTVRLRHILSSMVIEGVKAGEIKKVSVKKADDYLYSFIESAIFQLAILKRKNLDELRETAIFAVKQITV